MFRDENIRYVANFLFGLVILQCVVALARLIMPEGFILLLPLIAVGIWHEWPRVRTWQDSRKFRRELDKGLPFATDRDRL